mgnify:CR=1 FL=1
MYKIMTAGPTRVRENVRMARSLESQILIWIWNFMSFTGKPVNCFLRH